MEPSANRSGNLQDARQELTRHHRGVPSVDVIMLAEEDDQVNPAGVKGIGELGKVGTNAAVGISCVRPVT